MSSPKRGSLQGTFSLINQQRNYAVMSSFAKLCLRIYDQTQEPEALHLAIQGAHMMMEHRTTEASATAIFIQVANIFPRDVIEHDYYLAAPLQQAGKLLSQKWPKGLFQEGLLMRLCTLLSAPLFIEEASPQQLEQTANRLLTLADATRLCMPQKQLRPLCHLYAAALDASPAQTTLEETALKGALTTLVLCLPRAAECLDGFEPLLHALGRVAPTYRLNPDALARTALKLADDASHAAPHTDKDTLSGLYAVAHRYAPAEAPYAHDARALRDWCATTPALPPPARSSFRQTAFPVLMGANSPLTPLKPRQKGTGNGPRAN